MAGKHQIFSSNPKTKTKAKRCWRRQQKEQLTSGSTLPARIAKSLAGKNWTQEEIKKQARKNKKKGKPDPKIQPLSQSLGAILAEAGIVIKEDSHGRQQDHQAQAD